MKSLDKNWLTSHRIDFEYKKYILLAYLQEVKEEFSMYRLYPRLAELVEHYRDLRHFEEEVKKLKDQSAHDLVSVDLQKLQLIYTHAIGNDALMEELNQIVQYSLPRMKYHLDQGKELYEGIEEQMLLVPIGIVPLYKNEGYLLLKTNESRETHVYEYRITLFEEAHEKLRGIHTQFLQSYRNSLINTFEGIKQQLVKENKKLPVPATYLIESEKQYPITETLLPIARRMLVRYLAVA